MAEWLDKCMRKISDASMPRSCGGSRRQAYWWNNEIAELRSIMIEKRRKVTRYRSKNKNRDNTNREVIENNMYIEYRKALKTYKNSIRKSKRDSWNKTLEELNKEPWGTAFKIAMVKIRPATYSLCETLPRRTLEGIISGLFPEEEETNTTSYLAH
jgi:hypothetical protein